MERDVIIGTLRATGGNRTRTASMLGLSIRALRNKISLYTAQGIEVPPSSALPELACNGICSGGPGACDRPLLNALGPLRRLVPGGDVGFALCVLFQLSILILPIPTFLLDMALALSFIASILILLVSLSLERPLDFSSLPTLLLLTTILRLSLNVATARLILSHGSRRSLCRRTGGGGVRHVPDGRRPGGRRDRLHHAADGEFHRHHQGIQPHRRSLGALLPRLDAGQADGDRRRSFVRH